MYMLSMENVIQPSVFLTQGGWVGLIRYHMYDCLLSGSFLKACVELFALICCMICIFEIILYLLKYLNLARYLPNYTLLWLFLQWHFFFAFT